MTESMPPCQASTGRARRWRQRLGLSLVLLPLVWLSGCGGASGGVAPGSAPVPPRLTLFLGQPQENWAEAVQCANGPFRFTPDLDHDASGNLYAADARGYRLLKITPDRTLSTFAGNGTPGLDDGDGSAARFVYPASLGVDARGNVFVTDTAFYTGLGSFDAWHSSIRTINPAGSVSTLAGPSFIGAGAMGSVDGIGAAARFGDIVGVAADDEGNVYVGEPNAGRIRKIDRFARVTTFAGDGQDRRVVDGPLRDARFVSPRDFAFDRQGNLYVLDAGQLPFVADGLAQWMAVIRKITPDGNVSTLAGARDRTGANDGVGTSATFDSPRAMTIDPITGTLYVADTRNHTVRKITPAGVVSTLAGIAGKAGITLGALPGRLDAPTGITFVAPDRLYVTTSCAVLQIAPVSE